MQKESKVEEVKKMDKIEYEIQEVYEGDLEDIDEFEHEDGKIYYNNQGDIYNAEKQCVGSSKRKSIWSQFCHKCFKSMIINLCIYFNNIF